MPVLCATAKATRFHRNAIASSRGDFELLLSSPVNARSLLDPQLTLPRLLGTDGLAHRSKAGAYIRQPPRDEPWAMRSLIASDLDGNLICFASNLTS